MLHKFKPFELVVSQAPTGALRVLVMSALSILNLWAMPVTNAQAQSGDYPNRTIRMIVPQGAGGGTDILGRNVAAKFQDILRQSVVVENRTGAGSIIGTDADKTFYASPANGKFLGKTTLVVGLKKTF